MKKYLKYFFIGVGVLIAAIVVYRLVLTFLPDVKMYLKMVSESDKEKLMGDVRSHGIRTGLLLILLMCIFSAIPGFPVSVIAIFSGVCYGPWVASGMNIIGITLGNIVTYLLIKQFKLVGKKNNHWVKVLSKNKHPNIYLTLFYMIPVIPSFMVNYTADLLKIPFSKFIWMVVIGSVPTAILYAFGGDAAFKGNIQQLVFLLLVVGLLALLVFTLKKRISEKGQ